MVVNDSTSAHSTERTMPAAVPASGGQPGRASTRFPGPVQPAVDQHGQVPGRDDVVQRDGQVPDDRGDGEEEPENDQDQVARQAGREALGQEVDPVPGHVLGIGVIVTAELDEAIRGLGRESLGLIDLPPLREQLHEVMSGDLCIGMSEAETSSKAFDGLASHRFGWRWNQRTASYRRYRSLE